MHKQSFLAYTSRVYKATCQVLLRSAIFRIAASVRRTRQAKAFYQQPQSYKEAMCLIILIILNTLLNLGLGFQGYFRARHSGMQSRG